MSDDVLAFTFEDLHYLTRGEATLRQLAAEADPDQTEVIAAVTSLADVFSDLVDAITAKAVDTVGGPDEQH